MLSTIEILLMPICFALLFVLMLLYWGQTAFFSFIKYKKVTLFFFYLAFFSVTVLLVLRWVESKHLPLSNLYESLLFLSWSFLSIQAVLQVSNISINNAVQAKSVSEPLLTAKLSGISFQNKKNFFQNEAIPKSRFGKEASFSYNGNDIIANIDSISLVNDLHESKNNRNKNTTFSAESEKQELLDLIAVIFSPMCLLTYTFAFLNLPKEMQKATALVPALQSNWLMMHVSVMILSYAALLSGCLLAITYLLFNYITDNRVVSKIAFANSKDINNKLPDNVVVNSLLKNETITSTNISPSKLALSKKLDNYSYRLIGVGFPLLTIGILSGAVWANSAWGSYWSWDPKETWALITWLFFAIYLHARITRGWSGKKAAIIATIAFFVVWFCFLGVNLLGTGLHSYGWFKS